MNAKRLIAISIALFLCAALATAVDLTERGYSVGASRIEAGITFRPVRSPRGTEMVLGYVEEMNDRQITVLSLIVDTIESLVYVIPQQITVVFYPDRAEVVLVPETFEYQGTDLAPYLPSGMQFYYITHLEYDFRMLVDRLFLRVRGQYFTEEQFAEKLLRAAENPAAYLQSQDPEFIVRRFEDIEDSVDRLLLENATQGAAFAAGIAAVREDLATEARRREQTDNLHDSDYAALEFALDDLVEIGTEELARVDANIDQANARHRSLAQDHLDLTRRHEELEERHDELAESHVELAERHSELASGHEGLLEQTTDLEDRHEDLRADYEALAGRHSELLDRHESLLDEFELLRTAVIAMANDGFLGLRGSTRIEEAVVDLVLGAYDENPEAEAKDIRDALRAADETLDLSTGEVELILLVRRNRMP